MKFNFLKPKGEMSNPSRFRVWMTPTILVASPKTDFTILSLFILNASKVEVFLTNQHEFFLVVYSYTS